jgi:hypothetical protein
MTTVLTMWAAELRDALGAEMALPGLLDPSKVFRAMRP